MNTFDYDDLAKWCPFPYYFDEEQTEENKEAFDWEMEQQCLIEQYIIVNTETGEIVDDCRGYGFKSKHAAYSCFGYKQTRMKQGERFA